MPPGQATLPVLPSPQVGSVDPPAADAQSPRCPILNAFESDSGYVSFGSELRVTGSGDGAPWAVASAAAAEQYLATPEYATIRAILMSLELLPAP